MIIAHYFLSHLRLALSTHRYFLYLIMIRLICVMSLCRIEANRSQTMFCKASLRAATGMHRTAGQR